MTTKQLEGLKAELETLLELEETSELMDTELRRKYELLNILEQLEYEGDI